MVKESKTAGDPSQFAGAVYPGGALPVGFPFILLAFSVCQRPACLDGESLSNTDMRQPGLIGRIEGDRSLLGGAQDNLKIKRAGFWRVGREGKGGCIGQQDG